MVPLKEQPWSLPLVLISCLYHLYHLGLVPLSSYVWSRSWNRVQHFLCFCYIRNCSSPACNKSLIWSCQFTVCTWLSDHSRKTCVDSQMTFVKFLPLFSTHHYEQWECCGTHSVRYLLLSKVPEQVYGHRCLSNPSIFHLGFVFFFRVWVPLLHTCWFVVVMSEVSLCQWAIPQISSGRIMSFDATWRKKLHLSLERSRESEACYFLLFVGLVRGRQKIGIRRYLYPAHGIL